MQVRPYVHEDRDAALAFAERIAAGASGLSFDVPQQLHDNYRHRPRLTEKLVVVDDHGVHGGLNLRHDPFYIDGEKVWLGYYKYPISEGVINRRYAFVAIQLQQAVRERVGYVYGIGGGGSRSTTMQVLLRSGWSGCDIPFYFYPHRPARCFQEIPGLRRGRARRLITYAATQSGLGWAGVKLLQSVRSAPARRLFRTTRCEIVDDLADWADDLFHSCRSQYRMIASREADVIRQLYPSAKNLQLLVVHSAGQRIGWAVVVAPIRHKQHHFGRLSVGLVADFVAEPCHATEVIAAATEHLKHQQVDLIVCNASHAAWRKALTRCGYFRGASNFPFVGSPQLVERIGPFPTSLSSAHLTRADGDGLESFLERETVPNDSFAA